MEQSSSAPPGGPRLGSLAAVVGWIAAGAAVLAGLAVAAQTAFDLPVTRTVALGLGLALGGGVGGVAHLLVADDTEPRTDGTVTVEATDESAAPDPQPADLFDGHPDPVLYYTGDGAVVRAANGAFEEQFGVSTGQLDGTPVAEALFLADGESVSRETVTGPGLDRTVTCETPAGETAFRLRTVGGARSGYVLYTPVDP